MNPRNADEFNSLVNAVRESRRKLQPFREKRKELISLFCGSEYSDDAESKRVYLNILAMATNIYVRQCAVRAPTAKVTSPYREMRHLAFDLSIACKEAARETDLGKTLRRAVTEALYSPMAVVKVGLEYAGENEEEGETIESTKPFIQLVSFDDYVRDMSARSAYDPAFEGNTYYLTKEDLFRRYPSAKSLGVSAMGDLGMQNEGGEDRAESISHEPSSGDDNFNSKVAVQDIWLFKERKLVTYLPLKPEKPLDVVDFDAEEDGPYHSLWFTDIPDNAMPQPPFGLLKNIQELANSLFRRLSAQARSQKRIVAFTDEESANRFQGAHDGDSIYWDGQKPEELQIGGVDQQTLLLFMQVKDLFSWAAGNLDSLGGLSPMADTATQDKLLSQSANAQMADMQDAVSDFAHRVFRQIAWYEWTDPVRERIIQKPVPNTDIILPVKWNPDTRKGDFLDFNFEINPYSMREETPAGKVQKLQAVLMNTILPMMPMLEQQSLTLDIKRIIAILADYINLPELEQIITSMDPEAQDDAPGARGDPTPKPAHTHRTYERINRPGATRTGKDKALMQVLAGGNPQEAEIVGMMRETN